MPIFPITRIAASTRDIQADSLQLALALATDQVYTSFEAEYMPADRCSLPLIAELFSGSFVATDSHHNLFTLDDQMCAWICMSGSNCGPWLEIISTPSTNPKLRVSTSVMTTEELAIHIMATKGGWHCENCTVPVELDAYDCVSYKPPQVILNFLAVCETLAIPLISGCGVYLTTPHEMLDEEATPNGIQWETFKEWLMYEHGYDRLGDERVEDINAFLADLYGPTSF